MSPATRASPGVSRLWRTARFDIGRKLTALLMAVSLWWVLQNFVIDSQPLELPVHSVPTQEVAHRERATSSGVYLIVPDELIVRAVNPASVHLTVKGQRDDVVGLNISALLPFTVADLEGADELTIKRPLERDVFRFPAGRPPPRLTDFRVRPEVLEVTLARRETADLTLSADNVTFEGTPKEGYLFRTSRIRLEPITIGITGPRQVVEELLADPNRLKLEPVDIGGKSLTVSQWVGLPQELLDQGVSMQGGHREILVSVPIEAEDIEVELLAVPINYRNEDALETRYQRVTSKPESVDLKVIGPPGALNDLSDEALLQNIVLLFDWKLTPTNFVGQATGKVSVGKVQLPDSVRVTDLKGQELKIEYTLERVTPGQ